MESAKKSVEISRRALGILLGLNTLSLLGTVAMGGVLYREYGRGGATISQGGLAVNGISRVSRGEASDDLSQEPSSNSSIGTPATSGRNAASLPVVPGEFITEPFTVTLADSRATHYAKVHITIEPDRPITGPELERLRPRIRDYVTVLLSSKRLEEIDNFEGKEELRGQIQRGLERYVERDRLKNVFFSEFVLQ